MKKKYVLFLQMVLNLFVQSIKKKKKKEHPYLFQYKLSKRNETGTNHHGLHGGSQPNFNFFNVNP